MYGITHVEFKTKKQNTLNSQKQKLLLKRDTPSVTRWCSPLNSLQDYRPPILPHEDSVQKRGSANHPATTSTATTQKAGKTSSASGPPERRQSTPVEKGGEPGSRAHSRYLERLWESYPVKIWVQSFPGSHWGTGISEPHQEASIPPRRSTQQCL